jgi:putative component of membrane protein insertase Oxa1/YidC/SpoIIIJ protein YidD
MSKFVFLLLYAVSWSLLSGAFSLPAQAETWGPWSAAPDAPVVPAAEERQRKAPSMPKAAPDRISNTPFLWLLSFYQKVIGPVNAGRCPMYPTCSQYSVQALHKHGPVIGIVMTADRLIHEANEQQYAPLIKVGTRLRFHDPVENNDFWWYRQ